MNDLMPFKKSPLQVWLSGIEAGYFNVSDWKKWTEELILSTESAEEWVVNLYSSETDVQAEKTLSDSINSGGWIEEYSANDLFFGFVFMRFRNKSINIQELFQIVWDKYEDDAYGPMGAEHDRIRVVLLSNPKSEIKSEELKNLEKLYASYYKKSLEALKTLDIKE